jgi:hypothetical protein
MLSLEHTHSFLYPHSLSLFILHTRSHTLAHVHTQCGAVQNLLRPSSRCEEAYSERSIQVHSQGRLHAQERWDSFGFQRSVKFLRRTFHHPSHRKCTHLFHFNLSGDDAKDVRIVALEDVLRLPLAFDHKQILSAYISLYHPSVTS